MNKRAKRLTCTALAAMLLASCCGLFFASGQTQALQPKDKSYAWLEDVFFREKADQLGLQTIYPLADFPYSRTLADFRLETRDYADTYNAGIEGISQEARVFLNLAEVLFRSMGITETYEEQRDWLETHHGVIFPEKKDENTEIYTLILFTLLKYNIATELVDQNGKPIISKPIEIPYGVSLEQGILIFLLAAFETESDVSASNPSSFNDIMYELLRAALINYENNKFGVSSSTGNDDLLRYAAMMVSEQGGYTVEPDASDLVVNTYSILTTVQMRYGINIEPGRMAAVLEIADPDAQAEALARLILETMVLEKGGSVRANISTADLFNKALAYGYFPLGEDFYSDVYRYRIELKHKRSHIWFTPLCYADLMVPSGKRKLVTIRVDGVSITDRTTYKVPLDPNKAQHNMQVVVRYNDGKINQTKTYQFLIVQGQTQEPNNSNPKVIDNPDYIQPTNPTLPGAISDGNVTPVIPTSPGNNNGVDSGDNSSGSGWNLGANAAKVTAAPAEEAEITSPGEEDSPSFLRRWWPYFAGTLLVLLGGGGYIGYTRANESKRPSGKNKRPKRDNRF